MPTVVTCVYCINTSSTFTSKMPSCQTQNWFSSENERPQACFDLQCFIFHMLWCILYVPYQCMLWSSFWQTVMFGCFSVDVCCNWFLTTSYRVIRYETVIICYCARAPYGADMLCGGLANFLCGRPQRIFERALTAWHPSKIPPFHWMISIIYSRAVIVCHSSISRFSRIEK